MSTVLSRPQSLALRMQSMGGPCLRIRTGLWLLSNLASHLPRAQRALNWDLPLTCIFPSLLHCSLRQGEGWALFEPC